MHIPDGMLSPQTCAVTTAVMLPVWTLAARQARTALKSRQVPLLAALSAFSFTIMLFNVPAVGGTTTHAVGGTLLAIVLGPWAAAIGVTVAVAIQALLFGDGGILAFGANSLTMAFIGPFIGYATYRLLAGGSALDAPRRSLSAGIGAYVGLNAAALTAAVLLGLQPHLFHDGAGKALYFPLDLSATLPGVMLPHLLIAGVLEGVITAAGYAYLVRAQRPLLDATAAASSTAKPARIFYVLVAAILLAPLGMLAPGSAWGEWTREDLQKMVRYVPSGFSKLSERWHAPLADYSFTGSNGSFAMSSVGYWVSALLGTGLIVGLMFLFGLIARRRSKRDGESTKKEILPDRISSAEHLPS